jgi:tetratricopeptide (TPR) repeat protein
MLLAGCGLVPKFLISVDSINDPVRSQGKKYVLFSGDPKISDDDLQFREFAGYVRKVLSSLGYVEVHSPPANIAIFIRYGIGQPTRVDYSSSSPIFGITGGGTSSFTAFSSNGQTTMGTISSPPQLGVVGQNYQSGSYNVYPRWLVLEAADLAATRDFAKPVITWRTTVASVGTSADLRLVFPYLITAAKDYMGGNTGKMVHVVIYVGDKRVSALKAKEDTVYQSPNNESPRSVDALEAAKDWQGLLDLAQRWTESEPHNVVAWGTLGEAYSGLERYDDAAKVYRQIIGIVPELPLAWRSLGDSYLHLNRYNEAIDAYRQVMKIDPKDAGPWLNLGNVYDDLRRYNDAVEAYRQAIKLDPEFAPAWSNLGLAYSRSGNRAAALDAVRELRYLDPAMADKLFEEIDRH